MANGNVVADNCRSIPHGMNVYLPIAFCVLRDDCKVSQEKVEEELRILAKNDLPDFDEPVKYIFKESLQHTAQGKIDYRLLEEEAEKTYQ